jgi:hypothetical protein
MYGKTKSDAFLAQQTKDKSARRLYCDRKKPYVCSVAVKKSEETLSKLRKMVYVYDVTDNYKLLGVYPTVVCFRQFNMGYDTLNKRLEDGKIHKGKYFFSRGPYQPSS